MNRLVSVPIPDDSARWLAQLALLAQQELLELATRHGGHHRGGHHRASGVRMPTPIQPQHPHHAMRPLARFFATKVSLPPTAHPHTAARLLSQLSQLAQLSPAHAASVMATIAQLPVAQAQQLMETLASLPPALSQTLGQIIAQLPLGQIPSFIQLLAQLPPDITQALLLAASQNQLEALIDAHPDYADTLTNLQEIINPKRRQQPDSDGGFTDDDEEASDRLKKGWERWATYLYHTTPPT